MADAIKKILTITFADQATYDAMVNDYCKAAGYPIAVRDPANPQGQISNPISKEEFFRNRVVSHVGQTIADGKAKEAVAAAHAAVSKTLSDAKTSGAIVIL